MARCRCNREPLRGVVLMPGVEPPRGVDVVPDETTDAELDAMRTAGRLVLRSSEAASGPQDFNG